MDCVNEAEFLILLRNHKNVPTDLTYTFEGHEETIEVHKVIITKVSPVLREQFLGPLSANARAIAGGVKIGIEVVRENRFSYASSEILFQHIYGDKEVINNCVNFERLFEIVEMARFYIMENLEKLVQERIYFLSINLSNLLSALKSALHYKKFDGFQKIAEDIIKKVLLVFSSVSSRAQCKFFQLYRRNNSDLLNGLNDLMADFNLDKELKRCINCRMHTDRCLHGEPISAVPHPGMRYTTPGDEHCGENKVHAVTPTKKRTSKGQLVYDIKVECFSIGEFYARPMKYPNDFEGQVYNCRCVCKDCTRGVYCNHQVFPDLHMLQK